MLITTLKGGVHTRLIINAYLHTYLYIQKHKFLFPYSFFLFFFLSFFFFLGPYLQHMEVPRLGVELELQLPAYTTATAMPDSSRICDLHHSSWQHQILNPLSEARD